LPEVDAAKPEPARPSVFLSYASEDREATRALRDVLAKHGLEVWFDESELGGGIAWDQNIRRQIRNCDFFMPIISAQTERRPEGYFRREWRMAVERTLDMADDHPFLLPIAVDDVDQAVARVPEKFLSVQWLRVPGGLATPALESLCRRMVSGGLKMAGPTAKSRASGNPAEAEPARPKGAPDAASTPAPMMPYPPFPVEQPGQRLRFWVDVAAWFGGSASRQFKRLPRWIRAIALVWIFVAALKQCDDSPSQPHSANVTSAETKKLTEIAKTYQNTHDPSALATLGAEIAKEIADDKDSPADDGDESADGSALLAIAFTAPPGDAPAAKLADSTFAMTYGRVAISHRGRVALSREPPAAHDLAAAVASGKAGHAKYVLCGNVESSGGAKVLKVEIARVSDSVVVWSKTYDAAGADPSKISSDIDANVPALDSG
jgi:hypothetical protein